jgi:hypothetical protein
VRTDRTGPGDAGAISSGPVHRIPAGLIGDKVMARQDDGEILARWKPRMTKEEYLTFRRGIAHTELFDGAK